MLKVDQPILSRSVKLSWLLRTRTGIVRFFAWALRVPVEIKLHEMREYKLAEIDWYVRVCDQLFGPVFEPKHIDAFHAWVYPMLRENIDNIFNLYHHPLELVAAFFGVQYGTEGQNQEMEDLYERFRATGLKLGWYDMI